MENEERKQAHIYWDTNCPCASCKRWKDDDQVSLTDEGLAMLEMLEEQEEERRRTAPPEVPA